VEALFHNALEHFTGEVAIRMARMKVISGDAKDLSTGADKLSWQGDPGKNIFILREVSKRRDLPKEDQETLKSAIKDLEKKIRIDDRGRRTERVSGDQENRISGYRRITETQAGANQYAEGRMYRDSYCIYCIA
jgi:mRNA-degrading endonuclease RelE of RelBE toxin-antitoxin system